MNAEGLRILGYLERVSLERRRRAGDSELSDKVVALKSFQHRRFALTYADLLASPAYRAAARFFLDELYGPADFTQRDQQFERIVPSLTRLFPAELIGTVAALAELHALSEQLDSQMGRALICIPVTPARYASAWCAVGKPEHRERQIQLTVLVGRALERYTRRRLLRATLHAMRRPAALAGLGDLQRFLEAGFDTFNQISNPAWFLDQVENRERALARQLFDSDISGIAAVQP